MAREKKLIKQIEYGDKQALGELIEMYYADILRYCQWHTYGNVCPEDAAQETFLKAVRYMNANRFRGEFRPFLYKIARNTCIDLSRKRYRDDVYFDDLEQEPGYSESGFGQAESDSWMRQVLSRLEPEMKELILLRYDQGLTIKETAEIMELPMRTVQSKIRAVLKKLKIELNAEIKTESNKPFNIRLKAEVTKEENHAAKQRKEGERNA